MQKGLIKLGIYILVSVASMAFLFNHCDQWGDNGPALLTPVVSTMPDFPDEESLGITQKQTDDLYEFMDQNFDSENNIIFGIEYDVAFDEQLVKDIMIQVKALLDTGTIPDKQVIINNANQLMDEVLTDEFVNAAVDMAYHVIHDIMEPQQILDMVNFASEALIFLRTKKSKEWIKSTIDDLVTEIRESQYVGVLLMLEQDNPDFVVNVENIIANAVYDIVHAFTDEGEPILLAALRENGGTIDKETLKAGMLEMVERSKQALPIMLDYAEQLVNELPLFIRDLASGFINEDGSLNYDFEGTIDIPAP